MRILVTAGLILAATSPTVAQRPEMRERRQLVADVGPLSERDTNRMILLNPQQTITIELPSNPSTGYSWEATRSDGLSVAAIDTKPDPKTPTGRVGAPEIAVIPVTAGRPGRYVLTLVYRQPFDKSAAPAKTLTYRIAVLPARQ